MARARDVDDPRLPAREDAVLLPLMQRRVAEHPDAPLVFSDGGPTRSYAQVDAAARSAAAGLQALGVEPGDRVLSWLPTGFDALRMWLATCYAGGVHVPINVAYRGRLLEHVVATAQARVAVVHADLVERLAEIDRGTIETVVVLGADAPPSAIPAARDASILDEPPERFREPTVASQPWDVESIMFTSGTTGPSKGVLYHYAQLHVTCRETYVNDLRDGGRFLVNLPFFHIGGQIAVMSAIMAGAPVVLIPPFSTQTFWDVVRRTGGTSCALMGAMADFLLKAPERPDDADNPLRTVWMTPLIAGVPELERRFGLHARTAFNMTETSVPIIVAHGEQAPPGSCGRVRAGVEVRLVDAFDREVPDGEPGELIVRTDAPWTMTAGYSGNPEATAQLYRNGWLHTGDLLRRDEQGYYYFVDRRKDAIRRRGENISSFEVEAELVAHPDVREAAAIGVPADEGGEEEILAVVAPVPGRSIDPAQLLAFLSERMPHFMVPRYVRAIDALPKSQTSKIEKYKLRAAGLTPDTWDRVAAGISVRRQRVGG